MGLFDGKPPYQGTSVEVRKISGRLGHRFTPCNQCIYRNVVRNKLLFGNNTHALFIRWNSFNRNIRSGQGQPYTEIIGICPNYTPEREAL